MVGLQRKAAADLARQVDVDAERLEDTDRHFAEPRLIMLGAASMKEGDAPPRGRILRGWCRLAKVRSPAAQRLAIDNRSGAERATPKARSANARNTEEPSASRPGAARGASTWPARLALPKPNRATSRKAGAELGFGEDVHLGDRDAVRADAAADSASGTLTRWQDRWSKPRPFGNGLPAVPPPSARSDPSRRLQ
jgi:hypothetical protein